MTITSQPFVAPVVAAADVWSPVERVAAVVGPLVALALWYVVYRFARRTPWPRPFRLRFVLLHAAAAILASLAWFGATRALVQLFAGTTTDDGSWQEFLFLGTIAYTIVAGITYAFEANARAARVEALAARTQLAALRAQLHPHFLFNALHTVVQLIPVDPARAAGAAELVAELLRATLEEKRDEVTLADEWRFVSRYLELERIRFGERLVVRETIDGTLLDDAVPAFALQTLVENAVRHGAAHRVEPTEIAVTATGNAAELTLTVRNATNGATADGGNGTGLARLRERLAVLYGGAARLSTRRSDGVFETELVVPRGETRA